MTKWGEDFFQVLGAPWHVCVSGVIIFRAVTLELDSSSSFTWSICEIKCHNLLFSFTPLITPLVSYPSGASSSADTAKMTQPLRRDRAHQPAPARKSASLSSPSAARRLYRNLSGKFRVGTNPPGLEDSVVSGRWGDKERLRKTTIVSQKERKTSAVMRPGQDQCLICSQS